jgi:hypothetical protein
MSETRPTSLYLIAICNLVVGTLGVLCDSARTVSVFGERALVARYLDAKQQADRAWIERDLADELPHLATYRIIFDVAIPWFLTLALLASGVGLLRLRAWGWWLALLYGSCSFLHKIAVGIYSVVFLLAIYQQFPADTTAPGSLNWMPTVASTAASMRHSEAVSAAETMTAITMVAMPFILAIYPTVVLVVLCNPKVTAAFRREPPLAVQPA